MLNYEFLTVLLLMLEICKTLVINTFIQYCTLTLQVESGKKINKNIRIRKGVRKLL